MSESELRQRAGQYFRSAYRHQMAGEYDTAIELYSQSIEAYPTAEAYTFRGWAYSHLGDYAQAIVECKQAIKVDSTFGNPYNDIGAYLMQMGHWNEAIPWLQKATVATRYDSYFFPYYNLGRIHERNRNWQLARQNHAMAIQANAQFLPAIKALKRLEVMWN
jgi:tetratricopeptide (TPR) repeat protein